MTELRLSSAFKSFVGGRARLQAWEVFLQKLSAESVSFWKRDRLDGGQS